jgi:hypothetical protein
MRVTVGFITGFITLAAAVLALPLSAAAGQDAPPKLSIAAGGGVATPFHGDLDFTAPGWELSLRGAIAKHVVLEGFFEQWQRQQRSTNYKMRTVGFNALATGGSRRVTISGGGGVGAFAYDRRASTGNLFTSDGFTVQGVAEVDVAVAPRVQVFGRYLMVVPLIDPGFGHGTVMGGARVALW